MLRSNKMTKKILFWIVFLIAITQLTVILFQHREELTKRDYSIRYNSLKSLYYASQYVRKNNPIIITDEAFEAFASGVFLTGLNPIYIVHDHPPLGRYIIALSIIIFDNEKTIPAFLLIISVIGIFLISCMIIKNQVFAVIPVGILINEPLFLTKFTVLPLGEAIQLSFIIFAIYLFLLSWKTKHWPIFLSVNILIGAVVSIRYFILGVALWGACALFLLIKRNYNKLLVLVFSSPLILIILFASYTKTILDGYTLRQILGIQKYIFAYHQSAFVLPFSFWDLLLFNRWHTWWGTNAISSDPQWQIFWPVSVLLAAVGGVLAVFKKLQVSDEEAFLYLWIIAYSAMLSFGYSSTRYFLPLLPFLYILGCKCVIRLLQFFPNPPAGVNIKNRSEIHRKKARRCQLLT